jgi:hypothetical protein
METYLFLMAIIQTRLRLTVMRQLMNAKAEHHGMRKNLQVMRMI